MLIRPVKLSDFEAVLNIAKAAGIGMTSLPAHEQVLYQKIKRASDSFTSQSNDDEQKHDALYFFVAEDPDTGQIVGTTAIDAFVGLRRPFYSFKLATVIQHSDSLDIYAKHQILQIVNDYTGSTELGSLFLLPEYRRDRIGRLLSRVRFLFMAQYYEYFSHKVIAEIRGCHDGEGDSPFYNSLAKHFFQIPFKQADWLCATKGNKFISELMPSYPIYISLLPESARACIGKAYVNSEPAKAMLEREGFTYNNYLDIFDGGPTLEAKLKEIATIKNAKRAVVAKIDYSANAVRSMIANNGFDNFRATLGLIEANGLEVTIDAPTANILQLKIGDEIFFTNA
jgi:arginine N-succinyltransferase